MKNKMICIIIGMLLIVTGFSVVGITNTNSNEEINDPIREVDWWPSYQHDAAHTGFSTSTPPTDNPLWNKTEYGSPSTAPIILNDRMYFGTSSAGDKVTCLDVETGGEVWFYDTDSGVRGIGGSGNRIYATVNAPSKRVYCFDDFPFDDGVDEGIPDEPGSIYDLIWYYNLTGIPVIPVIVDEKMYLNTYAYGGNSVYCFDADPFDDGIDEGIPDEPGANYDIIWYYNLTASVVGATAVTNGKIYFSSYDYNAYCLDAEDGSFIWSHPLDGKGSSTTVIDDNRVYLSDNTNKLYCLDAVGNGNGTTNLLWNVSFEDTICNVAVGHGNIYLGSYDHKIYCYDADPSDGVDEGVPDEPSSDYDLIWQKEMEKRAYHPAIAGDYVYIGSGRMNEKEGYLYCYDADPFDDGVDEGIADPPGADYDIIWKVLLDWGSYNNPTHIAIALGYLYIRAQTTLYCFGEGGDNRPPVIPDQPIGPTEGWPDEEYSYSAITTDPDDENVSYLFDWGDGNDSGWTDFVPSGTEVTVSHTWTWPGEYNIRVKARDTHYDPSDFSDPLTITIQNDPPDTPNPPTGPTDGFLGYEYTYETDAVTDPNGDEVFYLFDWGDDSSSGLVETPSASHIWTETGLFEVTVTAEDEYHLPSSPSSGLTVEITNSAPETPEKPDGPTTGFRNFKYTFSTSTTDPEEQHQIRYGWDWGDGSNIEWTSFYDSGVTVERENKWNTIGTYNVSVIAQDEWGLNSSWSEPLVIEIEEPYPVFEINISGGKGITVVITNVGYADADDVYWTINIEGGLIFLTSRDDNGTEPGIDVDESAEITMDVMGFGWGIIFPIPNITVTASAPDAETKIESKNARVTFSNVKILDDESVIFHSLFSRILGR